MNSMMRDQRRNSWGVAALTFVAVTICLVAFEVSAQGLVPEDPATYTTFRSAPKFRAYLPSSMDLSSSFPTPAHQGSQGSCTAWATGYALRSYYEFKDLPKSERTADKAFSPAFIYNQVKPGDANCFVGIRISDALKFMLKNGTVPLSYFPYSREDCSSRPSRDLFTVASKFLIEDWERVNYRRIDDIKGQVAQGHPVAIGMMIPPSFRRLRSDAVFDDANTPEGSSMHAMVITGYDDERRTFKLMNSWGTTWGQGGFGWVSYDVFSQNVDSAFVMRALSKPIAEPAPKPPAPKPIVVKPPPVVEKPPPKPVPVITKVSFAEGVKARVEAFLARFECATLTLTQPTPRTAQVRGFVASNADLESIRTLLGGIDGLVAVTDDIKVRAWPQCEALQTFATPLATPRGLDLEVLGENGSPEFSEGDQLIIRVTAPDFAAYVYVIYLQAGGDAVHLVRPDWKGGPMAPGSRTEFGNDPQKETFRIAAPFGHEMIFAIATTKPLFQGRQPIVEEERNFLSVFTKAILQPSQHRDQRTAPHRLCPFENQAPTLMETYFATCLVGPIPAFNFAGFRRASRRRFGDPNHPPNH